MSVFVCLDGQPDVFEAEGILPNKWNGFVVPIFTERQGLVLWETFRQNVTDYYYGFDGQQFLMWNDYGTDHYPACKFESADGTTAERYFIGGRQWCWLLCNEKGEYIEG